MDIFERLAAVEDTDLQALLSHSLQHSLNHNNIAAQAEKNSDPKVKQAAGVHRDTSKLLIMLTTKLLDYAVPETPLKKTTRRKK